MAYQRLLSVKERKAHGVAWSGALVVKPKHRRCRRRPMDGLEARRIDHVFWRRFDACNGRCFLCGDPFTDDDWTTEEHVRPKWVGSRRPGNILPAHSWCNTRKGRRMPHPCEVLFLEAVNLRLPKRDLEGMKPPLVRFVPLRARLAAQAAE